MKKILVAGSIAYDHLMKFEGSFKESILPSQISNLSVSFLAADHDIFFGGCGGNIAYNLNLIGVEPLLYGVLGNDYKKYFDWLKKNSISTEYIDIDEGAISPAAYILSDLDHRQIAFFSMSAMANEKKCMGFGDADLGDVDMVLISPDIPQRMVAMAEAAIENGLPYLFDPGQAVVALDGNKLKKLIKNCKGVIVNSYEAELLTSKLGSSIKDVVNEVEFLIKTTGEDGCTVYQGDETFTVAALDGLNVVDSTGCGDAFRAGFLSALLDGKELKDACMYGHGAASFVLEMKGTQNHSFSMADIEARLS